jgi:hypothetical protein
MTADEGLRTQREELVLRHINAESANDVEIWKPSCGVK